ncbi:MAG: hypothetical protein ACOYU4_04990 [Thermodesulfobacteriota bacterium]
MDTGFSGFGGHDNAVPTQHGRIPAEVYTQQAARMTAFGYVVAGVIKTGEKRFYKNDY